MSREETDLKKVDECTDGNAESGGIRSSRRTPKRPSCKVPFDGHGLGPHCEGPDFSDVKLRQNVHGFGAVGTGGLLNQSGGLNDVDDHSTHPIDESDNEDLKVLELQRRLQSLDLHEADVRKRCHIAKLRRQIAEKERATEQLEADVVKAHKPVFEFRDPQ